MKYKNIIKGVFLERPNRFIANVEIDGSICVCHVKNTGRCKELLIKGATVFLEKNDNPNRKTKYDIVSVIKGTRLINMDSQVPNTIFGDWLKKEKYIKNITYIKPEYKHGASRLDFYIEANQKKYLIEVKGVTLEENGVVLFPDAPTIRGIKHINELIKAKKEGYETCIAFVVQMDNVKYFTPNSGAQPEFSKALRDAKANNVAIIAICCDVKPNTIVITNEIPVIL